MALKFNPAHRFTFSWEKKVDKKVSQSKNKKIPDTKKQKNIHKKIPTKKKDKKERHDDKTSTNGRFKTNPVVVILGYLTPLAKSIKH